MQRLLTGYAVGFNLRHQRSGHLFQNRYKSILCQEDAYFLELVRYIHLNPLRAGQVSGIDELDSHPFGGHGVLMGSHENNWQDTDYVLGQFGKRAGEARKRYREFVQKGIEQGRRPELVGGGLVRSPGGAGERIKSDARILGDSNFAEAMLEAGNARRDRQARLRAMGYDFDRLVERVAALFDLPAREVLRRGKFARTVPARSLLCHWANRELGISAVALAGRLEIARSTVSQSIARGEKIAAETRLLLLGAAKS